MNGCSCHLDSFISGRCMLAIYEAKYSSQLATFLLLLLVSLFGLLLVTLSPKVRAGGGIHPPCLWQNNHRDIPREPDQSERDDPPFNLINRTLLQSTSSTGSFLHQRDSLSLDTEIFQSSQLHQRDLHLLNLIASGFFRVVNCSRDHEGIYMLDQYYAHRTHLLLHAIPGEIHISPCKSLFHMIH